MTLVIHRKGHTRSHSEHGSQAFLSQWYSERGRVGCRQRHARVFVYTPQKWGVFVSGTIVRMTEHGPDSDRLPNHDLIPEDPTKTKVFVSREEKDINLDAALETLRMARMDLLVAKTPEAIIAAEKKLADAEAHFTRMNKGAVASSDYPRYMTGK